VSEPPQNWVKDLIRGGLRLRGDLDDDGQPKHGSLAGLARQWGVEPATLRKWWREGSGISAESVPRLIAASGGDFARALPGWSPAKWDPYTEANKDYVAKNDRLAFELKTARAEIAKLQQRLGDIVKIARGEARVIDIHAKPALKVADGGSHSPKDKPP